MYFGTLEMYNISFDHDSVINWKSKYTQLTYYIVTIK